MDRRAIASVVFALALVPSAYFAWRYREMPHFGHLHDDSLYFVCAKSLAQGGGYRIISLPGEPAQTKYPPLYPLLLAQIWKWNPRFPENLPAAMLAAWAALPVFLLLGRLWLCRLGFPGGTAWLLAAWPALHCYVLFFGISLMADLPFACLLLTALLLAEWKTEDGRGRRLALAAGFAAGAAFLTKTAAAPLAVTVPLCFLLRKRRAHIPWFIGAMLPAVIGWILWSRAHMSAASDAVSLYYTNYLGYQLENVSWSDLPAVVWKNLDGLLTGAGGLLAAGVDDSLLIKRLLQFLGVAAVCGAVRIARRDGITQYHAFAAGYGVLLLVWHYPPNERFLLPVLPLLLAGLAAEARHAAALVGAALARGRPAERAVAAGMAVALASLGLLALGSTAYGLSRMLPETLERNRRQNEARRLAYAFVSQRLPADAAVLAYHDPLVYLYTGRKACSLPFAPRAFYRDDSAAMVEPFRGLRGFAREQRLSHAILGPDDYTAELPAAIRPTLRRILAENEALRPLFRSAEASVYRIE